MHENADAAVQYNTTINDASTQLAQAVFAELYGPQGDEDGGAPAVTQKGRDDKDARADEKRGAVLEAQEQAQQAREQAKEAEDRAFQEFLNSADFEKLAAYYAGNPDMLDKVRGRLVEKGTSPSKAEKGAKEFQEFIDLKKKDKEGTLTPKDQERLTQIKKSEEFKLVTQEARRVESEFGTKKTQDFLMAESEGANGRELRIQVAKKDGESASHTGFDAKLVEVLSLKEKEKQGGLTSHERSLLSQLTSDETIRNALIEIDLAQAHIARKQNEKYVSYVSASAKESFPTASDLKGAFTSSSVVEISTGKGKSPTSQSPGMVAISSQSLEMVSL